jgi:hypothetical protein
MKGKQEAYVRFNRTPAGRWKISFVPARIGIVEEWKNKAAQARRGGYTVFFDSGACSGERLGLIFDQVAAWLEKQDIPDFADVSEWTKQAYLKQTEFAKEEHPQLR